MKKLVKPLMIVLLLTGSSTLSIAQDQKAAKTPEEKSARTTKYLTEQLSLDATQQKKVAEITLANEKKVDPIKKQIRELKKEVKAIRKQGEADINAVLTDEQKTKWTAIKEEKQKKRQEKPRRMNPVEKK